MQWVTLFGLDAPFHAGAHEVRIVVDVQPRHDGPLFAGLEFFERGFEHAGRRTDQRADLRGQIPGRTDGEAFDRVAELLAEQRVAIDFAFEDQERRGRALLAAVAERAVEHVLDRLVAVGEAVTIVAFLPPVSAKRFIVGLWASIFSAVDVPPVRITASTRRARRDTGRRCCRRRGRIAGRSSARRLARSIGRAGRR